MVHVAVATIEPGNPQMQNNERGNDKTKITTRQREGKQSEAVIERMKKYHNLIIANLIHRRLESDITNT